MATPRGLVKSQADEKISQADFSILLDSAHSARRFCRVDFFTPREPFCTPRVRPRLSKYAFPTMPHRAMKRNTVAAMAGILYFTYSARICNTQAEPRGPPGSHCGCGLGDMFPSGLQSTAAAPVQIQILGAAMAEILYFTCSARICKTQADPRGPPGSHCG